MEVLGLLKQLPVDLGQGTKRTITRGKILAMAHIPPAPSKGATLLDVGCREGMQSRIFEELGYEVTSIDVEKVWEGCEVVDCNRPLPFENDTFDVVWSSEVIEHLIDPVAAADEMRRVLRPGGTLVLTTPNSFPIFFCCLAMIGLTPQRLQRDDHLHFFDQRQIRRIFPQAQVEGFLPFTWVRPRLTRGVGTWSPTFVVVETKRWPTAERNISSLDASPGSVQRISAHQTQVARSRG